MTLFKEKKNEKRLQLETSSLVNSLLALESHVELELSELLTDVTSVNNSNRFFRGQSQ